MKTVVIKRDGCQVNFDFQRIQEAIKRASAAVNIQDDDYCLQVATTVTEQLGNREKVDIREIQDAVENQLMSGPYKDLARAYIEYRHDRDSARENAASLPMIFAALSNKATFHCLMKMPIKTVK